MLAARPDTIQSERAARGMRQPQVLHSARVMSTLVYVISIGDVCEAFPRVNPEKGRSTLAEAGARTSARLKHLSLRCTGA